MFSTGSRKPILRVSHTLSGYLNLGFLKQHCLKEWAYLPAWSIHSSPEWQVPGPWVRWMYALTKPVPVQCQCTLMIMMMMMVGECSDSSFCFTPLYKHTTFLTQHKFSSGEATCDLVCQNHFCLLCLIFLWFQQYLRLTRYFSINNHSEFVQKNKYICTCV